MNVEMRVARIRESLSQHRLSSMTGINQTLISMFEQGYRKPNRNQAQAIAKTLRVKVDNIFPEVKE